MGTTSAPRERRVAIAVARCRTPELELARAGTLASLVTAIPVVGVAGILGGGRAVIGGLVGVALVTGMYALSGIMLVCAARRFPSSLPVVSLVGVAVRFLLYGATLAALSGTTGIDRTSTAVTTGILLLATLIYETRYALTRPGFFWVQGAAPGTPVARRPLLGRQERNDA